MTLGKSPLTILDILSLAIFIRHYTILSESVQRRRCLRVAETQKYRFYLNIIPSKCIYSSPLENLNKQELICMDRVIPPLILDTRSFIYVDISLFKSMNKCNLRNQCLAMHIQHFRGFQSLFDKLLVAHKFFIISCAQNDAI